MAYMTSWPEQHVKKIKYVASCLKICPYGINIFLNSHIPWPYLPFIGMIESKTHPYNEMIFITVFQQGIIGCDVINEVYGAFRKIYIVDVYGSKKINILISSVNPSV